MFMDSLENAGSTGPGMNTLKQTNIINRPSTIMSADEAGNTSINQTQHNVTHHLADQTGIPATLHDLVDMEKIYRNFANTDSGLNTLIKANYTVSTNNEDRAQSSSNPDHYQADVRPQGSLLHPVSSAQSSLIDSAFGLQAIHAIRSELEKRELENVLSMMPRAQPAGGRSKSGKDRKPKMSAWPSKKYKDVPSSGYGRRDWSPQQLVKRSDESSVNSTLRNRSGQGQRSPAGSVKPRQPRRSSPSDAILNESKASDTSSRHSLWMERPVELQTLQ